MFAKNLRLSLGKKYQFSDIFNSNHLRLHIRKNDLLDNRYGILVSKKIDKRAVVRNSIRRGITQVLQEKHPLLKKPFDLFVFVTSSVDVSLLRQELIELIATHLQ